MFYRPKNVPKFSKPSIQTRIPILRTLTNIVTYFIRWLCFIKRQPRYIGLSRAGCFRILSSKFIVCHHVFRIYRYFIFPCDLGNKSAHLVVLLFIKRISPAIRPRCFQHSANSNSDRTGISTAAMLRVSSACAVQIVLNPIATTLHIRLPVFKPHQIMIMVFLH